MDTYWWTLVQLIIELNVYIIEMTVGNLLFTGCTGLLKRCEEISSLDARSIRLVF